MLARLHFCLQRLAGAHRKNLWRHTQQLAAVVAYESQNLFAIVGLIDEVYFVDHHDDLLAPLADPGKQEPFTLAERPVGAGHEEHEVTAWNKVFCNLLVALDDGIGAWCVDEIDLAQPFYREVYRQEIVACHFLCPAFAIAQKLDLARRGQDPFGQQPFAQKSVEKGRLPCIEFADDHQQEQLVKLVERTLEQG